MGNRRSSEFIRASNQVSSESECCSEGLELLGNKLKKSLKSNPGKPFSDFH